MFKDLNRNKFYFPDGIGGGITDDTELETKEEETTDEETETEESETEGGEKETEGEEEEVLARVEFGDVKKEFPDLFKKFPTLKHAFFREQQFSEIFPTVEEAQKALEAVNAYEEITSAVVEGDAQKFVSELREESSEGLEKFARNFIPAIRETNKDLFFEIVGKYTKEFLKDAYNYGKTLDSTEDKQRVQNAAKVMHKVLFGGAYEDVEKDISLARSPNKDEEKLQKDREEYLKGKYSELYNDVSNVCYSKLDEEINRGLDDLTKSKPGLKKILAKDIKERILTELDKDSNHTARMNSLWKREQRAGFNGSLKNSLVTTFLGRAKAILPKIRVEVRKEALGKEEKETEKGSVTRIGGGKESKGSGKKMTPERAKTEGLTTRQILDAD